MEKKIYIVTSGEYSDYGIDAVFTTKEKAVEYVEQHGTNYNIEEYNLDEEVEKKTQLWYIEFCVEDSELHEASPTSYNRDKAVDTLLDSLQEEPVSTKDKLLALSDGRLHLGWIDDAKVVEFEECLMQFHKDMSNIPQDTDSLIRLKDTDGVLHGYSKKLMSMAKKEPVSVWHDPDEEPEVERTIIWEDEKMMGKHLFQGQWRPKIDVFGRKERWCYLSDILNL